MSQITASLAKARTQLLLAGTSGAFHGALAMSLVPVIRDDIETAATDGVHLFYNPTWFDSLPERERVGVLVHEIRHLIALHHCRRAGRELGEFNIAADLAINPGIIADGFKLPEGILIDPQYAGLSAEEIYRLRQVQQAQQQANAEKPGDSGPQANQTSDGPSDDQTEGQSDSAQDESAQDESGQDSSSEGADQDGADQGETGQDGSGADQDGCGEGAGAGATQECPNGQEQGNANPGPESTGAQNPSNINDPGACGGIMDACPAHDATAMAQAEADMAQRVRQAVAVARKANGGTLPADLARLIGELAAPKLDARDMLRRFIDRSISKAYAWTRPNKRYLPLGITLPSLVADRPGHIVALVDVSGSLWSDTAQRALATELQGALDNGAADQITVVYADTDVTGSAEYFPGDQIVLGAEGGGGTDFRAPLQWVADNCESVSAILYLTDMETCDFGAEPDAPLLWLVYGDPRNAKYWIDRAPFGEAVYIDE